MLQGRSMRMKMKSNPVKKRRLLISKLRRLMNQKILIPQLSSAPISPKLLCMIVSREISMIHPLVIIILHSIKLSQSNNLTKITPMTITHSGIKISMSMRIKLQKKRKARDLQPAIGIQLSKNHQLKGLKFSPQYKEVKKTSSPTDRCQVLLMSRKCSPLKNSKDIYKNTSTKVLSKQ